MAISYTIYPLKAFYDNYIWIVHTASDAIVVDPGEGIGVIKYLNAQKLKLEAILLTHSHDDHYSGVMEILNYFKYPIPLLSYPLAGEFKLIKTNISVKIISTPGHTLDSISFLVDGKLLFCGDTLFGCGCGKVFSKNYELMFESLNKLAKLPIDTLIYPAHEYTLSNLKFASLMEPDNPRINERFIKEQEKLKVEGRTLPTSLETELLTNPFLRANESSLVKQIEYLTSEATNPGLDCFIKIRKLKDNF